jgi:phosphocarrier protein HPr
METSETNPSTGMAERTLTVQNKTGIHARPAAMIVRITNRFKSDVFFEKGEEQVNGKSIMGLMMLAAGRGSKIKVSVQGEDADQLLDDLEELFGQEFEEG